MVHSVCKYYYSEYDCVLVFNSVLSHCGIQYSVAGVRTMLWVRVLGFVSW
jgi:hypothetical protein